MKENVIKLLILLIVVTGMTGVRLLDTGPTESNEDWGDYGKLKGWIVDPETEAPVNECFIVRVLRTNEKNMHKQFHTQLSTNDKGYLSKLMKPGTYYLSFKPVGQSTRYSFEPYPYNNDKFKFVVTVERGKLTKFTKRATLRGRLKLLLVNPVGDPFDPSMELQKPGLINVRLNCPSMLMGESYSGIFHEGEHVISSLFPDTYEVVIDMNGFGMGIRKEIRGIKIEAEKKTDTIIEIALDHSTGIEGRIFDKNGSPIFNAKIGIWCQANFTKIYIDCKSANWD